MLVPIGGTPLMALDSIFPLSLHILLIEDTEADALLIKKKLDMAIPEGYQLTQATTLEEALNLLPHHMFDIALLDCTLSDAENFDGLYSLQNMAPNIPIIFLTAHQHEHTALESIKKGAQDYLLKHKSTAHSMKRIIQFAILRKKFENTLLERANFDLLTGLANRWLFENRLDVAIAKLKRHDSILAILFLDLDLFKQINDRYGHTTGDKVLQEVSRRLKQPVRPYDTVARFGGDEFAVLLECIATQKEAEQITKRIITLLEEPIAIYGEKLTITVSIGISICKYEKKIFAEQLIQQADKAMYKAKSTTGSSYYIADYISDALSS